MLYQLSSHPAFPAPSPSQVTVAVAMAGDSLQLDYTADVDTSLLLLPPPAPAIHTDELWRHMCCEVFMKPAHGTGYYEYNFSPSGAWAAYIFDDYRAGRHVHEIPAPLMTQSLTPTRYRMQVTIAMPPAEIARLNLCVQLETLDGVRSFWTINHPDEKPNFHHPEAFVVTLPATSSR